MGLNERPVFKIQGDSKPLSAFEIAIRNLQSKHVQGLEYLTGILQLADVKSPSREAYYNLGKYLLEGSSNTFVHGICVTGLCLDFVDYDNGDRELKQTLGGVILHDIGKLGLDYDLRSRKTKLHKDQLASIYEHPKRGADMLLPELLLPAYIAGKHHILPNGKGYGVDIEILDSMRLIADEALKFVRIFDFLDSMEFGKGKSINIAQYDSTDKQAVIRAMSNHFYTPKSGAKIEYDPLIEKAVDFYWRHRPRDEDYAKLMDAILKKAA